MDSVGPCPSPVRLHRPFSAAGPALGYLAQVDYALLAALERMDDEDDFAVSIETLDDIVFHDADSDDATEKWQSKHTIDETRSLSDASTDLWKTVANWIAEPGDANTRLVLLAVADAGPTAALLRAGADRDVARAQERLERTAHISASETNAAYYAAFLALAPEQRRRLLDRVEIFDGVLPIAEVQPLLERAVRKSVKPQRRAALVDRLRGWWDKRAIAHLDAVARGLPDRIGAGELEAELLEIADALRDENLPIDVLDMAEPTEREVSENDRLFVAQLRLIALSSERLRKCIYDHNRAFAQRSRWQRDRLLEVGELSRYDRELKEAWERFFLPVGDDEDQDVDEDTLRRRARQRFAELDRSNLAPIRRDVREGWVARGSLHVIADRLEIGWASAVARIPTRPSGRGQGRAGGRDCFMSVAVAETRRVEELGLFNAAFLALLVRRAADEHERRSGGRALPTMLAYLALPLALHGPTRRQLPSNVTAQMGEWIRAHPDAAAGLGERARALRPLVSDGLRLGLAHGLLAADAGSLRANALPRRPRGMARSAEVDECIDKAGFLGRWFSEQPDPVTTLALWGLRP